MGRVTESESEELTSSVCVGAVVRFFCVEFSLSGEPADTLGTSFLFCWGGEFGGEGSVFCLSVGFFGGRGGCCGGGPGTAEDVEGDTGLCVLSPRVCLGLAWFSSLVWARCEATDRGCG